MKLFDPDLTWARVDLARPIHDAGGGGGPISL
jgi:hypothetical protein